LPCNINILVESQISSSKIINDKEKGIRVTQAVTGNIEGLNQPDLPLPQENLNSARSVSALLCLYYFLSQQFRKNPRFPVFQEKPIYKQGNFRWATSSGQGPIALPPITPNDAHLSEGDVFIRIDTASSASSPETVQAWCASTTPYISRLIWKPVTVLVDIRIINGIQYTLSLCKNMEPSWILVKSALRIKCE